MNHSRKINSHLSDNPLISDFINKFGSISLSELNQKADMLERIDNKYILDALELSKCGAALSDSFDILEID
jgi:hypothetical protein